MVLGFFCFIVPGLVASLSLCFCFYAMVENPQLSPPAALRRSHALVWEQGHLCRVTGFFVSWALIWVLVGLVCGMFLGFVLAPMRIPVDSAYGQLVLTLVSVALSSYIGALMEVGKVVMYRELAELHAQRAPAPDVEAPPALAPSDLLGAGPRLPGDQAPCDTEELLPPADGLEKGGAEEPTAAGPPLAPP